MKSTQTAVFRQFGRKSIVVALIMGAWFCAASCFAQTADFQLRSKWDESLLNVEFRNVNIDVSSLEKAWEEIAVKQFLRCNIYCDKRAGADEGKFVLHRDALTGKEMLDALLAAFPNYTFTQDPETRVIWLHPKSTNYSDILSEKFKIERPVWQVQMNALIYTPMWNSLGLSWMLEVTNSFPDSRMISTAHELAQSYCVDLPSGTFPARQIFNYCCVANPARTFFVTLNTNGGRSIVADSLYYGNPMIPPRPAAVAFWKAEIGQPKGDGPKLDEVRAALSEPNPRIRWAARGYLQAAPLNYQTADLINKAEDPRQAIWAGLGLKTIDVMGRGDFIYLTPKAPIMAAITNDLVLGDPGLALLVSMEMARESKNPAIMETAARHKFTAGEVQAIKPDLCRIARESKLVRDKLLDMKTDLPGLPPEDLQDLGNSNICIPVTLDELWKSRPEFLRNIQDAQGTNQRETHDMRN